MLHVLKGKRVLVVDDEPDVCEMVKEELSNCNVDTAWTYDEAKAKLSRGTYDVVVLDIMGVRGHDLLDEFATRFPCIMLTANALSPENLKKAMIGRARLYIPKEELAHVDEYVAKVLLVKEPLWGWLFKKLDFRRWFGQSWLGFDADFFKGFALSDDEVRRDLEYYERTAGT